MIPGPNESEKHYQMRLKRMETATHDFQAKYPNRKIQTIAGYPVFIGKTGLKIWEAGALWVYEDDHQIRLPLIQLKKYSEETLNHEKVHCKRIAFDEKRFEEIFAYLTSSKVWRKKWGALFRTELSLWGFLILSFCPLWSIHFIIFPLGFLGWQMIRLFIDRRHLLNVIEKLGSFERALYLTDNEIIAFSKMSKNEIFAYLKKNRDFDLRICKLMQLMS
ncbi:MAG: hypothetical protein KDK44_03825 [Chlamydiia bacterium]|nr:hypothetical protein [Chlamydiia bacterium]MCP5509403.1 hypothetical protein [Chlamydiales bacterium]